ncbi:hypothetical protein evm_015025 [Chilo suppressalis]|nr:hypothetical protein evm_015025 [Chilo suppressalis]
MENNPPTMKPKEVNMPNKRKKKLLRKSIKRLRCIRIGKPCKKLPDPDPLLSNDEEEVLVKVGFRLLSERIPKQKTDLQLSVASFLKKTERDLETP